MATATTPNGSTALAHLEAMERDLILQEWIKAKQREGELRVATRRNRTSGVVEIVYLGVHEKADLTDLKRAYETIARAKVRTF